MNTFYSKPDASFPIQYEKRECRRGNMIVDFQMDIVKPELQSVQTVNGASAQLLGFKDREYIQERIKQIWDDTDFRRIEEMNEILKKAKNFYCSCCGIFWIILCIITGAFCLICCMCYMAQTAKKMKGDYERVSKEWQDLFIQNLKNFIHEELKQKYPQLTFNLIYPVNIYQTLVTITYENNTPINQTQRPTIKNIYCYIRVSNGPLPISDSYEPFVDSTQSTNSQSIGGAMQTLSIAEGQDVPLIAGQ